MITPNEIHYGSARRLSGNAEKHRNFLKNWFLNNVDFEPEVWRILNEEIIRTTIILPSKSAEKIIIFRVEYGTDNKLYETELTMKPNFKFPNQELATPKEFLIKENPLKRSGIIKR